MFSRVSIANAAKFVFRVTVREVFYLCKYLVISIAKFLGWLGSVSFSRWAALFSIIYIIFVVVLPFSGVVPVPGVDGYEFSGWNEFGDYLTGFISPLALAWFIGTLFLQKRELELQREELKENKIALQRQVEQNERNYFLELSANSKKYNDEFDGKVDIKKYVDAVSSINNDIEYHYNEIYSSLLTLLKFRQDYLFSELCFISVKVEDGEKIIGPSEDVFRETDPIDFDFFLEDSGVYEDLGDINPDYLKAGAWVETFIGVDEISFYPFSKSIYSLKRSSQIILNQINDVRHFRVTVREFLKSVNANFLLDMVPDVKSEESIFEICNKIEKSLRNYDIDIVEIEDKKDKKITVIEVI